MVNVKSYQLGRVAQKEERESRVPVSLVGTVGISLKEASQKRLLAPVKQIWSRSQPCPISRVEK